MSNKSLIIDITQTYKRFLECLDYQDFHSRISQKIFLIDCTSRSVYFFIVILSLEIKPVVAEEKEPEQGSNPSLLIFFDFCNYQNSDDRTILKGFLVQNPLQVYSSRLTC